MYELNSTGSCDITTLNDHHCDDVVVKPIEEWLSYQPDRSPPPPKGDIAANNVMRPIVNPMATSWPLSGSSSVCGGGGCVQLRLPKLKPQVRRLAALIRDLKLITLAALMSSTDSFVDTRDVRVG